MFHGNNLIPESLEIGEPTIQSTFSDYDFEPCYVIAYSGDKIGDDPQDVINQSGEVINGIFSSIAFIVCNPRWFQRFNELAKYTL